MSKSSASVDQVCYAARSDIGMRRPMNQDAFEVILADGDDWPKLGHRFIVADGMGAHAAGELASQLAVEEVSDQYNRSTVAHRESLETAFKSANSVIYQRGQEDTQLYNMGTTCSALMILPQGALVGHVGDSRVYRCRGPQIQQLTRDHSLVWEMRAVGQLDDDRNSSVPRNVITRCLGPHPEVDVDIEGLFSVQPGDTFLLCSDGLTGRISDAEIGAITRHLQPEEAVNFLIDLANLRGGSDNITIIVTRILSKELTATGEVSDAPSEELAETHPAWWFVAAGGLATALVSYRYGQYLVSALGGVTFLLAAAGAALQSMRHSKSNSSSTFTGPPYAKAVTAVNQAFTDSICETLEMTLESLLAECPHLAHVEDKINNTRSGIADSDATSVCQELANISRLLCEQL